MASVFHRGGIQCTTEELHALSRFLGRSLADIYIDTGHIDDDGVDDCGPRHPLLIRPRRPQVRATGARRMRNCRPAKPPLVRTPLVKTTLRRLPPGSHPWRKSRAATIRVCSCSRSRWKKWFFMPP